METKFKIKKRYIGIGLGALALVAGIIFAINSSFYVSTDDAYVETHTVGIAPRVSGQVIKVYVTDNQKVKEGDLIAEIDSKKRICFCNIIY